MKLEGQYTLLLLNFLNVFAYAFWGPLLIAYAISIGASPSLAGAEYAYLTCIHAVMIIVFGKLESKTNSFVMVTLGYFIQGCCALLYWIIPKPIYLFIPLTISSIAGGMIAPSWKAMYTYRLKKGKAGSGWSYVDSGNYFVTALGTFVAGMLAGKFGFRVIFIPLFVVNMVAVVFSYTNRFMFRLGR